jgi:hypothetical protein
MRKEFLHLEEVCCMAITHYRHLLVGLALHKGDVLQVQPKIEGVGMEWDEDLKGKRKVGGSQIESGRRKGKRYRLMDEGEDV